MIHATTVLAVRREGRVAVGGDGQVTVNSTIMKQQAKKVRRLYHDRVIVGFAGTAADGLALFERLEGKLEAARGNLQRAAVELAKDWRTDRALRRLEALLIAANEETLLVISGTGDLIEPDDGVAAVGSGGAYALAAARALLAHTTLSAEEIVRESLRLAAQICVYTNEQITVETI